MSWSVHNGREMLAPYDALGADDEVTPFVLSPQVVRELKRALRALGEYEADAARSGDDPATELLYKQINPEESYPYWDPVTADAFALAMSRYKDRWVDGPWVRTTPVGFQPTARGLEVIAGAVRELLGGVPALSTYEAWRGGMFAPPSMLSAPAADAPVVPTFDYGPSFRYPPPVVLEQHPQLAAALAGVEAGLKQSWLSSLDATDEATRQWWSHMFTKQRLARDILVDQAIDLAEVRTGEDPPDSDAQAIAACHDMGGSWDAPSRSCKPSGAVSPPGSSAVASSGGGLPLWQMAVAAGLAVGGVYAYHRYKAKDGGR